MLRNTSVIRRLSVVAITALMLVVVAASVSAHEGREVEGEFEFVVGFMNEPAYVNQMNGLDLRITYLNGNQDDAENGDDPGDDHEHSNGEAEDDHHGGESEPVENAHQSLNATIIYGSEEMELDLRPVYNQPGAYTAEVIPTSPGTYTFHIHGEIDGIQIDETFVGGPDTFSEPAETDDLEFPAGAGEVVGDSDQTAAMAIAGVVAGLLGLLVGGFAYFKVSSQGDNKNPAQKRREARLAEQQAQDKE
jgi:hypothetical protein